MPHPVHQVRLILAPVLAPLVLAAFILAVGSEYTRLNIGSIVAAVFMANTYFWLCFVITSFIRNVKGLATRVAPSLIFAFVGLALSCLGDASAARLSTIFDGVDDPRRINVSFRVLGFLFHIHIVAAACVGRVKHGRCLTCAGADTRPRLR
jgi:hypothetical protein